MPRVSGKKSAKKSGENSTPRVKIDQDVRSQIIEDHKNGLSAEDIAAKHGISIIEYVRRVIRKESLDTPNLMLPPFVMSTPTPLKKAASGKKRKVSIRQDSFSDTESVSSECSYKLRSRTPKSVTLKKLTDFREVQEFGSTERPSIRFRKTPRRVLKSAGAVNIPGDGSQSELSDAEFDTRGNEPMDLETPPAAEPAFTMTPGPKNISFIREESFESSYGEFVTPSVGRLSSRLSAARSVATDPLIEIRSTPRNNRTPVTSGSESATEILSRQKRKSMRDAIVSPIHDMGAAGTDVSIQTDRTVYYEQKYIDFLESKHKEQMQQKDVRIEELSAALDVKDEENMSLWENLKQQEKDISSLKHDLKTVRQELHQERERLSMEKGWKKYF